MRFRHTVEFELGAPVLLAGVVIVGMLLVSARRMVSMKSPHANWGAPGVYSERQAREMAVSAVRDAARRGNLRL